MLPKQMKQTFLYLNLFGINSYNASQQVTDRRCATKFVTSCFVVVKRRI